MLSFDLCCRYLHVLQPNVEAVRADRRGSVPAVHNNHWVSYSLPDRRGSEPSLHPGAQEFTSQGHRGSDATHIHVANLQQSFGHLTTNIVEEDRASSPLQQGMVCVCVSVHACHKRRAYIVLETFVLYRQR